MKNLFLTALALILCGCGAINNGYVVSQTCTTLGLDVSENPQSQLYHAKFGYTRQESAFVPTNRSYTNGPSIGNGAKDSANVLMEVRYGSIFRADGGIYQRLAVGDIAVSQSGAAFMFAKDARGTLSSTNAYAVAAAFGNTNTIQTPK